MQPDNRENKRFTETRYIFFILFVLTVLMLAATQYLANLPA